MSAAARSLALLSPVLALAACGDAPREGPANNAAVTEIEALPPDESVEAPVDEFSNEAAEPPNADAAQY